VSHSRAAGVISNALALQEMTSSLYENSCSPGGVIEYDKHFPTDEVGNRIRDGIERLYRGPARAGKVALLELGMKWRPVTISPEDAELLASRRFTGEELARLTGKSALAGVSSIPSHAMTAMRGARRSMRASARSGRSIGRADIGAVCNDAEIGRNETGGSRPRFAKPGHSV
jgi:hypothetical protein